MIEASDKVLCQLDWSLERDVLYLDCVANEAELLSVSYTVVNAQGQPMASGIARGARYPVSTDHWPAGIYWVVIKTSETIKTAKVVRQ